MKTIFSIMSFLAGGLSLAIGLLLIEPFPLSSSKVIAGLVAVAVGLACLWLGKETATGSDHSHV